jgi:alanine racemase
VTIRLVVRSALWRSHVARVVNAVDGLVPVVKGNGYGFGRVALAETAAEFADTVAVGTVHELAGLPEALHVVVLTPTLHAPPTSTPILTVGEPAHLAALAGWDGRVIVKAASSMRRYGTDDPGRLVAEAEALGLEVVGVSVHPPLAGTDDEHLAEIAHVAAGLDADTPIWISHLDPDACARLPSSHRFRVRLGTALWHGDKSFFSLGADVLEVRRVTAGERAGYRLGPVPGDGSLVMIGAGTANGVAPLSDGRSPFHFDSHRLALHEPPHMHTSMAFVPAGDPCPEIGEWVDLQRPLTTTTVDEFDWR